MSFRIANYVCRGWRSAYFLYCCLDSIPVCIIIPYLVYLHHGLILNAQTLFSFSSVNGSPVEQIDRGEVFLTAKKRRGEGRVNFANDSSIASIPEISIGIGVGNGETIDLSDPNQRKNLNREQKTFAMQQLMAIQEQMNKLMADF